jgi:hypothetical protein
MTLCGGVRAYATASACVLGFVLLKGRLKSRIALLRFGFSDGLWRFQRFGGSPEAGGFAL